VANPVSPELLERLLEEHGAALELFAAQWTHAPDDCVQEAFLQLVRQRTTPERVVPWLYRVVRNRAISLLRQSHRQRRHEAAASRQEAWFAPTAESTVDPQLITAALRELPDEQREVIVARIWGGLNFEQIGEVVGASTSSAHRRYEAGLKTLRIKLGLTWLTNQEKTGRGMKLNGPKT
jgi:RNA polymerase sigma factor (sigma-70 family)